MVRWAYQIGRLRGDGLQVDARAVWPGGETALNAELLNLSPESLKQQAQAVAERAFAFRKRLEAARRAVSMLVGRDPQQLDAHGVARACVESVGENLTDGILSTLFWAIWKNRRCSKNTRFCRRSAVSSDSSTRCSNGRNRSWPDLNPAH